MKSVWLPRPIEALLLEINGSWSGARWSDGWRGGSVLGLNLGCRAISRWSTPR
jgi:hypothetical protein